jgi:hypothetical protein
LAAGGYREGHLVNAKIDAEETARTGERIAKRLVRLRRE